MTNDSAADLRPREKNAGNTENEEARDELRSSDRGGSGCLVMSIPALSRYRPARKEKLLPWFALQT